MGRELFPEPSWLAEVAHRPLSTPPPLSCNTQLNVSRCSEFHGLWIQDLEARNLIFHTLGMPPAELELGVSNYVRSKTTILLLR